MINPGPQTSPLRQPEQVPMHRSLLEHGPPPGVEAPRQFHVGEALQCAPGNAALPMHFKPGVEATSQITILQSRHRARYGRFDARDPIEPATGRGRARGDDLEFPLELSKPNSDEAPLIPRPRNLEMPEAIQPDETPRIQKSLMPATKAHRQAAVHQVPDTAM